MKTTYLKLYAILFITLLFSNKFYAQEEHAPGRNGEVRTLNMRLPLMTEATQIQVEIINGLAIFEGDIILGPANQIRPGRGGATTTSLSVRWTNGVIPYEIPAGRTSDSLVVVRAINEVNSNTNLNMRPKTSSDSDYVRFNLNASGYSSQIGKMSGVQPINVKGGTGHPIKGKIMHEIGHAAGLYHEHTRTDRDTHVVVDTANVIAGKRHNFRKFTNHWNYGTAGGTNVGSYDYGSIMHYPSFSGFAIDSSRPIITTIPAGTPIGQRTALSAGDIQAINSIYTSSAGSSTPSTGSGSSTGSSSNGSSSVNISYSVQLVPQTSGMSCWAASAAMIVGWRDRISIDPQDIARGVNGWEQFYNNGLPADNVEMFSVWGLQYEYPQSYTIQGFTDLLNIGPLWVATDLQDDAHVVVVSGIRGDGTPNGTILTILDPWEQGMTSFRPSNSGSTYEETYQEFVERQERLARSEMDQESAFYIAY